MYISLRSFSKRSKYWSWMKSDFLFKARVAELINRNVGYIGIAYKFWDNHGSSINANEARTGAGSFVFLMGGHPSAPLFYIPGVLSRLRFYFLSSFLFSCCCSFVYSCQSVCLVCVCVSASWRDRPYFLTGLENWVNPRAIQKTLHIGHWQQHMCWIYNFKFDSITNKQHQLLGLFSLFNFTLIKSVGYKEGDCMTRVVAIAGGSNWEEKNQAVQSKVIALHCSLLSLLLSKRRTWYALFDPFL